MSLRNKVPVPTAFAFSNDELVAESKSSSFLQMTAVYNSCAYKYCVSMSIVRGCFFVSPMMQALPAVLRIVSFELIRSNKPVYRYFTFQFRRKVCYEHKKETFKTNKVMSL